MAEKQEMIHQGDTEAHASPKRFAGQARSIRLLDLFHLPTRVLRAFGAGRNALRQMRATIGRKRTRAEKSCLRASVVRLVLSVSSIVLTGKF